MAATVPSSVSKMVTHALLKTLSVAEGAPSIVALGTEGFPESQMAAFLQDATLAGPPLLTPLVVPPDTALQVIA